VLVVLLIWAASQGGYYPIDWYPGAVFALALLVVSLLSLPARGRVPGLVQGATALLAAYAAWSYLSIAWADQQGPAWDGANQAALYAIVFALFALWPLRGGVATALLGAFVLAIAGLGVVELLSVDPAREPGDSFVDGRFTGPIGYVNGNVALWTLAFWPCLALGSRRDVPAALRPLFLASATFVGGLAVMAQSRGWLFALPVVAIVFVALSRGARIRGALALALVVLAGVGVWDTLLEVHEAADRGATAFEASLDDARGSLLQVSLAVGLVAAAWAIADLRVRVPRAASRVLGTGLVVAAVLAGVGGLAVYSAREGSPLQDVSNAWEEFKTGPQPGDERDRFSATLGSNRYDFWRVAWRDFRDHPLVGVGAENFQQSYLERGRSYERPRHTHSLPVRILSQTGIVGAMLLAGALAAALAAALGAIWRGSARGSMAASAATVAFVYWLVHGGVDWFWEMPALGGSAFALLGLACSLAPRRSRRENPAATGPPAPHLIGSRPSAAVALALAAIVGVAMLRPWLAEVYIDRAAETWRRDPAQAFGHLDRASDLNPLAVRPVLVEAAIASRLERLDRAEAAFREALERDSRNAYAMLNLGVIEWELGRRSDAIRRLEATRRVDPRYVHVEDVLERMQNGELLDVNAVNREITRRASRLAR
jgi:tetratricopeptide (TPR) repeat protein